MHFPKAIYFYEWLVFQMANIGFDGGEQFDSRVIVWVYVCDINHSLQFWAL